MFKFIVSVLMVLSLVGCNSDGGNTPSPEPKQPEVVAPICIGSQTLNVEANTCENPTCIGSQTVKDGICINPVCLPNQHLDTGVCINNPVCIGNQTLNTSTYMCDNPVCAGDQTIVGGVCVNPTCIGDQSLESGSCVNPMCIGDQSLQSGICINPTCIGDQTLIGGVCINPTCIGDQTLENGICVNPTCIGDQTLIGGVCINPTCIGDQTLIGGVCINPVCIGNQTLENGICVNPTCIGDQSLESGMCINPSCVGNQTLENGVCQDPVCTDDQHLDTGVCIDNPTCVGEQTLDQSSWTCVDPTCGEGYYLSNHSCLEIPTCSASQHLDSEYQCIENTADYLCDNSGEALFCARTVDNIDTSPVYFKYNRSKSYLNYYGDSELGYGVVAKGSNIESPVGDGFVTLKNKDNEVISNSETIQIEFPFSTNPYHADNPLLNKIKFGQTYTPLDHFTGEQNIFNVFNKSILVDRETGTVVQRNEIKVLGGHQQGWSVVYPFAEGDNYNYVPGGGDYCKKIESPWGDSEYGWKNTENYRYRYFSKTASPPSNNTDPLYHSRVVRGFYIYRGSDTCIGETGNTGLIAIVERHYKNFTVTSDGRVGEIVYDSGPYVIEDNLSYGGFRTTISFDGIKVIDSLNDPYNVYSTQVEYPDTGIYYVSSLDKVGNHLITHLVTLHSEGRDPRLSTTVNLDCEPGPNNEKMLFNGQTQQCEEAPVEEVQFAGYEPTGVGGFVTSIPISTYSAIPAERQSFTANQLVRIRGFKVIKDGVTTTISSDDFTYGSFGISTLFINENTLPFYNYPGWGYLLMVPEAE